MVDNGARRVGQMDEVEELEEGREERVGLWVEGELIRRVRSDVGTRSAVPDQLSRLGASANEWECVDGGPGGRLRQVKLRRS
jgi:hypothetical protein